jgi:hypothetical protein
MKKIAISLQVSWFCFALVLGAPVGFAETGLPGARAAFQPLSGQEKFDYYVQHTFAVGDFLERSALAGIAQWRDSPPEWGQGWTGYGHRLGSNFGQYSIKKTLQFGIGAALKEDPRYFASTESGFWRRASHAVSQTVIVKNDYDRRVFSYGRVTGTLGGSFISRTWHPERQRTAGHALPMPALPSVPKRVGIS